MLKRWLFVLLVIALPMMPMAAAQEDDDLLTQRLNFEWPEQGISIGFGVPGGWNVRFDSEEILMGSSEILFDASGDLPVLAPFEVAISVQLSEADGPVTPDKLEELKSELFTYDETMPDTVGDMTGFSAIFDSERLNGKIFVLNYSESVALSVVVASGEYLSNEATVLEILNSLEITPLETSSEETFITLSGEDETVTFGFEFPGDWVVHTGSGLMIGNSEAAINHFFMQTESALEGDEALMFVLPALMEAEATPAETLAAQIEDAGEDSTFGEIEPFTVGEHEGAQVSFTGSFGVGILYVVDYPGLPIFFFVVAADQPDLDSNLATFTRIMESFGLEVKAE